MDFSKAFDKVPHRRLNYKLDWYGIRGNTREWILDFLSGRSQRVVLEGASSDSEPVVSGVPQGTVLGPVLFLLYINDLPDVAVHSTARLFADDCIVYRPIRNNDDTILLQNDLNKIAEWEFMWQMQFNIDKCFILRVGRPKHKLVHVYTLHNQNLSETDSAKYLAVADSGGGGPGPPFGKVKKCKRAPLTENDVLRSRFFETTENFCYSATTPPPPTESRRHGTSHESGPPPWENPGSATV